MSLTTRLCPSWPDDSWGTTSVVAIPIPFPCCDRIKQWPGKPHHPDVFEPHPKLLIIQVGLLRIRRQASTSVVPAVVANIHIFPPPTWLIMEPDSSHRVRRHSCLLRAGLGQTNAAGNKDKNGAQIVPRFTPEAFGGKIRTTRQDLQRGSRRL